METTPSPISSSSNDGSQESLQKQTKRKGIIGRIFMKRDKIRSSSKEMVTQVAATRKRTDDGGKFPHF